MSLFIVLYKNYNKKGGVSMAKTKNSVRGKQQKKIVVVKSYTKKDGTKVNEHRRSTPN